MPYSRTYEIDAPNCYIQVAHHPIKGWAININRQGFIPLNDAKLSEHQLDMIIALYTGALYPEDLRNHLQKQRLAAKRRKESSSA